MAMVEATPKPETVYENNQGKQGVTSDVRGVEGRHIFKNRAKNFYETRPPVFGEKDREHGNQSG
ncbi:MAG: hypothetical protein JRJ54_14745 [Deltaproteobacteria bacterium]|nr:hypothetical protein [Deltaproteobacteria bacterium]